MNSIMSATQAATTTTCARIPTHAQNRTPDGRWGRLADSRPFGGLSTRDESLTIAKSGLFERLFAGVAAAAVMTLAVGILWRARH